MSKKSIGLMVAGLLSASAGALSVQVLAAGPGETDAKAAATATAKPSITSAQRARLAERLALINQIVQAAEPDMQANNIVAMESKRWMLESLYTMSLAQIQAIGVPGSFEATSSAITKAAKVSQKALGDAASDLVYRPIAPCRFIDSRNVLGPISGSRTYDLDGTGSPWGGSASCNPVTASGVSSADDFAAVAINVTIIGPAGAPGFIGARPVGSTNTTSFVNWYQSGASVQAANAGAVSTFQGVGDEIEFFGSPTNIIVDVFGVFTRPDATAFDCVNTEATGSGTFTNGTVNFVGAPACTAPYTRTAVACAYNGTAPDGLDLSEVQLDSSVFLVGCLWRNNSATSPSATNLTAQSRCCRVPGR